MRGRFGIAPADPHLTGTEQFQVSTAGEPPGQKVELETMRRKRHGRFIPPMPLDWFERVSRLPGKAPVVATLLWYRSKREGSATVTLTQVFLNTFGISRQARYRALQSLEAAGLISVQRRPRKSPVVTVLPA